MIVFICQMFRQIPFLNHLFNQSNLNIIPQTNQSIDKVIIKFSFDNDQIYSFCVQLIDQYKNLALQSNKKVTTNMHNQEPYRKKTRSQLQQEEKSGSYIQIPSQNNLPLSQQPTPIQVEKYSANGKQAKLLTANSSLPALRKSNWIKKQRIKYLVFLNYYSEVPHWSSDHKSIPTYKSLSLFIKTRSAEQCKSFHLSMRRNFKSNQEMIKVMHEQLANEQGYQRLIDRYDLEIITYEDEHKILEIYDLKEKQFYSEKWKKTCHQNGYQQKPSRGQEGQVLASADQLLEQADRQLDDQQLIEIQHNGQPEDQYDFRINIRELMKEPINNHNRQTISPQQNKPQYNNPHQNPNQTKNFKKSDSNTSQPKENQSFIKAMPTNINNGMLGPSINHAMGMNFYIPQNNPGFNPVDNIQQYQEKNAREPFKNMATLDKNYPSSFSQRQLPNTPMNFTQQNIRRVIQANNNPFAVPPFPGYQQYQTNGFQNMPLTQFQSAMQFSMPPPGGLPYLLHGYSSYPFQQIPNPERLPAKSSNIDDLSVIDKQNRNKKVMQRQLSQQQKPQKSIVNQRQMSLTKQKQNVISPTNIANFPQNYVNPSQNYVTPLNNYANGFPPANNAIPAVKQANCYSQRRKELIIKCHENFVNWMRGTMELNRRREKGQGMTVGQQ